MRVSFCWNVILAGGLSTKVFGSPSTKCSVMVLSLAFVSVPVPGVYSLYVPVEWNATYFIIIADLARNRCNLCFWVLVRSSVVGREICFLFRASVEKAGHSSLSACSRWVRGCALAFRFIYVCLSEAHWRTWWCIAWFWCLGIGIGFSFVRHGPKFPPHQSVLGVHDYFMVSLSYRRINTCK